MDQQNKEQIMGGVWEACTSPTDIIVISTEKHAETNEPISDHELDHVQEM